MKWGRNQSDRNHHLGHSYVYQIAARLGLDMPQAQLDIYNRGVSGNTVANLCKRWEKDAIEITPDLLSVLIGTNDEGSGVPAPCANQAGTAILAVHISRHYPREPFAKIAHALR